MDSHGRTFWDVIVWIFTRPLLVAIIVLIWLGSWAIAHSAAAPGTQVSILAGLVQYTKGGPDESPSVIIDEPYAAAPASAPDATAPAADAASAPAPEAAVASGASEPVAPTAIDSADAGAPAAADVTAAAADAASAAAAAAAEAAR